MRLVAVAPYGEHEQPERHHADHGCHPHGRLEVRSVVKRQSHKLLGANLTTERIQAPKSLLPPSANPSSDGGLLSNFVIYETILCNIRSLEYTFMCKAVTRKQAQILREGFTPYGGFRSCFSFWPQPQSRVYLLSGLSGTKSSQRSLRGRLQASQ